MAYAERNRGIKKLLEQAFGKGKVRVKGGRGTACGWVHVHICHAPRNWRENGELRGKVQQLLNAAKVKIGTYGYDDPGSDYGYGQEILINFDPCREQADHYGDESWRQRLGAEEWDQLQVDEAARAQVAV